MITKRNDLLERAFMDEGSASSPVSRASNIGLVVGGFVDSGDGSALVGLNVAIHLAHSTEATGRPIIVYMSAARPAGQSAPALNSTRRAQVI